MSPNPRLIINAIVLNSNILELFYLRSTMFSFYFFFFFGLPPIWHYSPKVFKRSVPFSFLRQYESINMKSWMLLILNKLSELMRTPFPNPPMDLGSVRFGNAYIKSGVHIYSLVPPLWKKCYCNICLQFQSIWPRMNKCDHWTLKNCV